MEIGTDIKITFILTALPRISSEEAYFISTHYYICILFSYRQLINFTHTEYLKEGNLFYYKKVN